LGSNRVYSILSLAKVFEEAEDMEILNLYAGIGDKRTLLNNCVEPELGLHILNAALNPIKLQGELL